MVFDVDDDGDIMQHAAEDNSEASHDMTIPSAQESFSWQSLQDTKGASPSMIHHHHHHHFVVLLLRRGGRE